MLSRNHKSAGLSLICGGDIYIEAKSVGSRNYPAGSSWDSNQNTRVQALGQGEPTGPFVHVFKVFFCFVVVYFVFLFFLFCLLLFFLFIFCSVLFC